MTWELSLTAMMTAYVLAILFDLARVLHRAEFWVWGSTALVAYGWFTHTLDLGGRFADAWERGGSPVSNWSHWCLAIAWVLVGCDLFLKLRRPATAWGVFLLPLAIAYLAAAWRIPAGDGFQTPRAYWLLALTHGGLLLAAAIFVSIGFAGGVMYLMQARRLKLKVAASRWPRLPSLEWLWWWNERLLVLSVVCLLSGLGAGIAMNVASPQREAQPIPWHEPLVWASILMMIWVVTVAVFHGFYPPARLGNKVAYLTVASFFLFALLLWIVFVFPGDHTRPEKSIRVTGTILGLSPPEAWGRKGGAV